MAFDAQPTRRNIIKTIGVGAIAGTSLIQPVLGKDGSYVEIAFAKNDSGVTHTKMVPQQWRKQWERARVAIEYVKPNLTDTAGIRTIYLTTSSSKFGGVKGFDIGIGIDADTFSASVPENVNGVKTRIIEREEVTPTNCYNDSEFSDIPGGVTNEFSGTSTCRVNRNGSHYIMTCSHLWFDHCNGLNGEDYVQWTAAGSVTDNDAKEDWAIAEITESGRGLSEKIVNDGYGDYPTGGWIVESSGGIGWLQTNDKDTMFMGGETGHQFGEVNAHGGTVYVSDDCMTHDGHSVEYNELEVAGGDSGAPHYYVMDEDNDGTTGAFLISNQSTAHGDDGTTSCSSADKFKYGAGTAFDYINDQHNIGIADDS